MPDLTCGEWDRSRLKMYMKIHGMSFRRDLGMSYNSDSWKRTDFFFVYLLSMTYLVLYASLYSLRTAFRVSRRPIHLIRPIALSLNDSPAFDSPGVPARTTKL